MRVVYVGAVAEGKKQNKKKKKKKKSEGEDCLVQNIKKSIKKYLF